MKRMLALLLSVIMLVSLFPIGVMAEELNDEAEETLAEESAELSDSTPTEKPAPEEEPTLTEEPVSEEKSDAEEEPAPEETPVSEENPAPAEESDTTPEPTEEPAVTLILLAEREELTVGETVQITPVITPEGTELTLAWSSSDEAVLTVDENGLVTAIAAGEANVIAEAGEVRAELKLTVLAAENEEETAELPTPATATATIVASGECGSNGDNLTWTLDSAGTLTISGTGEMDNYEFDYDVYWGVPSVEPASDTPWADQALSIKRVVINSGVTSIGVGAFRGCKNLTSVSFSATVTTIEGQAFAGCTSLKSVSFPENLEKILIYAFCQCTSLTTVSFCEGLQEISDEAFSGCTSLKNVSLPQSLISIGCYAFAMCSSLKSITIPANVQDLTIDAFYRFDGKTEIAIDSASPYYKNVDGYLFSKDGKILYGYLYFGYDYSETYSIPDTVVTLADGCLESMACGNLVIPESVTEIGANDNCDIGSFTVNSANPNYKSVDGVLFNKAGTCLISYPTNKRGAKYVIPDGVSKIVRGAFGWGWFDSVPDWFLTRLTIPASVTTIEDDTFLTSGYLEHVYYLGTEAQWQQIKIEDHWDLGYGSPEMHYGETDPYENPAVLTITYYGVADASNPNPTSSDGNYLALQDAAKTGYTFCGWYKDSKYKKRITEIPSGTDGTLKLYAKWTANKYTVSFNANGGKGTMKPQTHTYGKLAALSTNAFKRTGYTFLGWTDGTNTYTNKQKITNLTAENGANISLTALWTPVTYKITYKNVTAFETNPNPATYNIEKHISLNAPTRPGCEFAGWYLDSKFKKPVSELALGTTGNKTLYAKWTGKANTYSVSFDSNGGKGIMLPQLRLSCGKVYTLKTNAFKRAGYAFAGWKAPDGTVYGNKAKIGNLTAENGGTVTLTAQWVPITYKITYKNTTYATSQPTIKTYTVEDEPITLETSTRPGYTFAGWYTNSKFKASSKLETIPEGKTGNLTLYAKWVKE